MHKLQVVVIYNSTKNKRYINTTKRQQPRMLKWQACVVFWYNTKILKVVLLSEHIFILLDARAWSINYNKPFKKMPAGT